MHRWNGELHTGGLNRAIGGRLIDEIGRYEAPQLVETGAGASTLLFCSIGVDSLISIAPDEGLRDRILEEAARRKIDVVALTYLIGRSEIELPRLAMENHRANACFIDGCHNWPAVFVDFCYMNMMMTTGSTLSSTTCKYAR